MKSEEKTLGLKTTVVRFFNWLLLIVMLHNTFFATSQQMIVDCFQQAGYPVVHYGNNGGNEVHTASPANTPNNNLPAYPSGTSNTGSFSPRAADVSTNAVSADLEEGVIGTDDDSPIDSPRDNLFKFVLPEGRGKARAFLTYELYGVENFLSVARSINNRPATGGYLVKSNAGWRSQKEEINPEWLVTGENQLLFGIPKNAHYEYRVRNVKLEFTAGRPATSSLVVNIPENNLVKDGKLYIKGFVRNAHGELGVVTDGQQLALHDGEFEGFLTISEAVKARHLMMVRAADANGFIGQEAVFVDGLVEADRQNSRESFPATTGVDMDAASVGSLKTEDVSIDVPEGALAGPAKVSVTRLRFQDMAPMGSGMINVSGNDGYRFAPDGTKFKKPIKLALRYDEKLIPKGYTPNDIKTFYFDTKIKNWVAVERDSIDLANHKIISRTDHFTDYINGIIQSPESPETAGFTPTMMSGIQTADPASEMTLMDAPQVSQTGEAGVGYPIKVPAGRGGLQPALSISYSNDGPDGWLGEGWDLATPSVSMDTRWGVPLMDADHESDIYLLNGEQLMYPKLNGSDWMPNRHYEVAGTTSTVYSTQTGPELQMPYSRRANRAVLQK